jgi:hypothetical protein
LIEKDFTPTAKKNSTNAGEVNSAAFVYPIDDVSKENIIKRLEHINKAYLDREIFPLQLNDEPFPKMNLAEFGELFMDVIGEKTLPQPLIWNQDRDIRAMAMSNWNLKGFMILDTQEQKELNTVVHLKEFGDTSIITLKNIMRPM